MCHPTPDGGDLSSPDENGMVIAEGEAEQDELLRGQMSPVSGYSSGDDLMAHDQAVGLPLRHSTPNIGLEPVEEGNLNTVRFGSFTKVTAKCGLKGRRISLWSFPMHHPCPWLSAGALQRWCQTSCPAQI